MPNPAPPHFYPDVVDHGLIIRGLELSPDEAKALLAAKPAAEVMAEPAPPPLSEMTEADAVEAMAYAYARLHNRGPLDSDTGTAKTLLALARSRGGFVPARQGR